MTKRMVSVAILAVAMAAGSSAFRPAAFGCGSTGGPGSCRSEQAAAHEETPLYERWTAWLVSLFGG